VLLGPNRLKLTELLLKHGASIENRSDAGSSILLSACDSEDSDPDVVRLLLQKLPRQNLINFRRTSRTLKWKLIRSLAVLAVRCQSRPSSLIYDIARHGGVTAIQTAALRGDMEIVEILLSAGADPKLKNDLGQDTASMCKSFPELQGLLMKRQRVINLRGTGYVEIRVTFLSYILTLSL
jgi:ankyrin repeat protein